MATAEQKFADLRTRILSAIVIALIGLGSAWAGGLTFQAFLAVATGLIFWEILTMLKISAERSIGLGVAAAVGYFLLQVVPLHYGLGVICLVIAAGFFVVTELKHLFVAYAILLFIGAHQIGLVRDEFGVGWVFWLLFLVIATDVLGYFAGRIFGGPKFWPAVSPKKTWSGIVAGWAGAAVVGYLTILYFDGGTDMIAISVGLSFASQMGDIAESALKRKVGVKDSSNLIPGHGGVFDRFDGMLGAGFALFIIQLIFGFPGPGV